MDARLTHTNWQPVALVAAGVLAVTCGASIVLTRPSPPPVAVEQEAKAEFEADMRSIANGGSPFDVSGPRLPNRKPGDTVVLSSPARRPLSASSGDEGPDPFEEVARYHAAASVASTPAASPAANPTPAAAPPVTPAAAPPPAPAAPVEQTSQALNTVSPDNRTMEATAREALRGVGMDPAAEAAWTAAINDPSLSASQRRNLIEDLNETGFSNPSNPTPADLPLITSRIQLIERMAPSAMDEANAAAFREAYKDLQVMYERVMRR